jgi:protein-tyrosine-phosphatase
MKKFLFICYGNVGRSQMAEAYTNYFSEKEISINAGTADVREIVDNHPLPNVIQIMKEDGIDISKKQVRQIDKSLLAVAERIIVLCKKTDCPDYLINKSNVTYHEFPDPTEKDISTTRKIRNEIKAFISELLHH